MNITKLTSVKTICNSYLIEENGFVVIVDPGQDGVVEAEIERKGYRPEYILLTHEHFDHVEDLEAVRGKYGIPVIASRICSERLEDPKTNLSIIEDILSYYKTGVIAEEILWRGHRFTFVEAPGHSPGSVLITLDDAYYFTGDYMILRENPTLRLRGGSEEDYRIIAEPILEKIPDGAEILPGHGDSYTKGREPQAE